MADGYLAYPDSLIQHNGLPVTFLTGSNIGAYGDWDLIIERYNCANNASPTAAFPNGGSYSGVSFNSAMSAVKTMVGNSVINHKFIVGTAKEMSSTLIYGTDQQIRTSGIPTESAGRYLAYYYDNAAEATAKNKSYVYGLKWSAGVPTKPDITNHGDKNGYSIIHKFNAPTATSLAYALNASNWSEIHNVYVPKASGQMFGALNLPDDHYSYECLRVLDNVYAPNEYVDITTGPIETVNDVTATRVSVRGEGVNVNNVSAKTYLFLTGCNLSVDTLKTSYFSADTCNINAANTISATKLSFVDVTSDSQFSATSAYLVNTNLNITANSFTAIDCDNVTGGFLSGTLENSTGRNFTAPWMRASGSYLDNISANKFAVYSGCTGNVSAESGFLDGGSNANMTANSGHNFGNGLLTVKTSADFYIGQGKYALDFNSSAAISAYPKYNFSARGNELPNIMVNVIPKASAISSDNVSVSGTFNFNAAAIPSTGNKTIRYRPGNGKVLDMSHVNFINDSSKTSRLASYLTDVTYKFPTSARSWLEPKLYIQAGNTVQWV